MKFNIGFITVKGEESELNIVAASEEEALKIARQEASLRRAIAVVSEIENEI